MTEQTTNQPTNPDEPIAPPGESEQHGGEYASSGTARLVRDAAARAAALRETWDRSYQAARTDSSGAPRAGHEMPPSSADHLGQLLDEQRQTNALLRDVLAELRRR